MARGKTASAPTRTKAKSSAKASTSTASRTNRATTAQASTRRSTGTASSGGATYRELYAEAQRRDIKGRSSMDKAQLERVLSSKRGK